MAITAPKCNQTESRKARLLSKLNTFPHRNQFLIENLKESQLTASIQYLVVSRLTVTPTRFDAGVPSVHPLSRLNLQRLRIDVYGLKSVAEKIHDKSNTRQE